MPLATSTIVDTMDSAFDCDTDLFLRISWYSLNSRTKDVFPVYTLYIPYLYK